MPRCAANTAKKCRCKKGATQGSSFCTTHKAKYATIEFVECSICLGDILRGDRTTSCGHHFHTACLQKWLVSHNTCPNCRTELCPPKPQYTISQNAMLQEMLNRLQQRLAANPPGPGPLGLYADPLLVERINIIMGAVVAPLPADP
jgi:hypothetical protein